MFIIVLQRIILEAIVDILYFPLWWYSRGALHAAGWCLNFFKTGNASLAPGLWFVNIFTPMFGQYDWQGRIVSFFMRSINVIGRGIALFIWGIFCLVLLATWFLLPVLMVYSIYSSYINKLYLP